MTRRYHAPIVYHSIIHFDSLYFNVNELCVTELRVMSKVQVNKKVCDRATNNVRAKSNKKLS